MLIMFYRQQRLIPSKAYNLGAFNFYTTGQENLARSKYTHLKCKSDFLCKVSNPNTKNRIHPISFMPTAWLLYIWLWVVLLEFSFFSFFLFSVSFLFFFLVTIEMLDREEGKSLYLRMATVISRQWWVYIVMWQKCSSTENANASLSSSCYCWQLLTPNLPYCLSLPFHLL